MGLGIFILEAFDRNMGVYLGRREGCVTEHFLNASEIRARVENSVCVSNTDAVYSGGVLTVDNYEVCSERGALLPKIFFEMLDGFSADNVSECKNFHSVTFYNL